MLKNKASYSRDAQDRKNNDSPQDPTGSNRSFIAQSVEISKFLPMTSDHVSRDTGITTGQISRPNQAFANEAAFGQVFGFGFVGHEAGVSGRGGGTKGLNGSVAGFKCQRVLGIDSSNRGPVQLVGLEDVVNYNPFFANFYAGVPKKQPSKICEPNVNPGLCCNQEPGIYSQGGYSKKRKDESSTSHYSTRSGVKGLSIHFPSLTQLATHRGECC
jgi:hypothetical protein